MQSTIEPPLKASTELNQHVFDTGWTILNTVSLDFGSIIIGMLCQTALEVLLINCLISVYKTDLSLIH